MGLIDWIKPSLEGKDGKSSARAMTNAWYVTLNSILSFGVLYLCFIVVNSEAVNSEAVNAIKALTWLICTYNITILLIFGIVTAQNINEGIRAVRGIKEPITITTETKTKINDEEITPTNNDTGNSPG